MILMIGYGNPLRCDDAIGQIIAQVMEQRFQGEDVAVKVAYQLTPELVEPISHARLVIFIDARVGKTPGVMMWEIVDSETGSGGFSHHVSPGTLLGAAHELYSVMPAGVLISIVGASFDYSSELSPQLSRLLPNLVDQVEEIINTVLDGMIA